MLAAASGLCCPHKARARVAGAQRQALARPQRGAPARGAAHRGLATLAEAGQDHSLEQLQHRHIEAFGFRPEWHYDFERGPMIGAGTFGVVHVARHISSGQKYAVKSIPKLFGYDGCLEPSFVARVFHEVDVSRCLGQSLNVIHLVEAYEDDVSVDLVMELAAGGSLWSRITRGGIAEATAARIIADVLRAVAQCHAKGIIIRDVKPENFLFMTRREASPLKMVDFGLAERCRPGQTFDTPAGTPFYLAPEVIDGAYSFPADVWSAGVTAYQLLAGRLPWGSDPAWVAGIAHASPRGLHEGSGVNSLAGSGGPGVTSKLLWRAIQSAELDFTWPPWDSISEGAVDLVSSMLCRDPEQRPTAAQLLQHPWLAAATGRSLAAGGSWSSNIVPLGLIGSLHAPGNSNGNSSSSSSGHSNGHSNGHVQHSSTVLPLEDSLVQRLQRWGTFPRAKQIALREVAALMALLSPQPPCLAIYAAEFASLDPANTGLIPSATLEELLASPHWDLSDVEIGMLVAQFDLSCAGSVSTLDWLAALIDWPQAQAHPLWPHWVEQVFQRFDGDGDGIISRTELAAVLGAARPSGGAWSELDGWRGDSVPSVLRHADANGDGSLCREEFAALLQTDAADQLELFPTRRRVPEPLLASGSRVLH